MPQPMRSSIDTWQGTPCASAIWATARSMGLGPQAQTAVAPRNLGLEHVGHKAVLAIAAVIGAHIGLAHCAERIL